MSDIVLTGVPRGGTTLACRLLGECQDTVALPEPIAPDTLPQDRAGALQAVVDFFADARAGLRRDGTAPARTVDGRIGDNFFDAPVAGQLRRPLAQAATVRLAQPLPKRFHLVVKHNALFAALLPELAACMRTLAIVRHPLAVLASWQTVDLPVAHGRLPVGERLDPALARSLAAAGDEILARQLCILDWFFARYLQALPRTSVLRYEDIIHDGGARLRAAAGLQGDVQPLTSRNQDARYPGVDIARLAARLAGTAGAWSLLYPPQSIPAVAERLCTPSA